MIKPSNCSIETSYLADVRESINCEVYFQMSEIWKRTSEESDNNEPKLSDNEADQMKQQAVHPDQGSPEGGGDGGDNYKNDGDDRKDNEPTLTRKAAYQRQYRAEYPDKELLRAKNREYQTTSRHKLGAYKMFADTVLRLGAFDVALETAAPDVKQSIIEAFEAEDITIRTSSEPDRGPKLFDVSEGTYKALYGCERCTHCARTCRVAGVCNPTECACYNANTMCDHAYPCKATPLLLPTQRMHIKVQGRMGLGAFALRRYPPDFYLGEMTGIEVSQQEAIRQHQLTGHAYIVAVPTSTKRGASSTRFIDASKGGQCRFINHSCEANVRFELFEDSEGGQPCLAVYTTKSVEKGQAFGLDYGWSRSGMAGTTCLCESKHCKGVF